VGRALDLPDEDVLALLQSFCTLDKANRRWQLKGMDDPEFLWAFPEVRRNTEDGQKKTIHVTCGRLCGAHASTGGAATTSLMERKGA